MGVVTLTLTEFLTARLDEDEAVARAAMVMSGTIPVRSADESGRWVMIESDYEGIWPEPFGWVSDGLSQRLAEQTWAVHAQRHDPARVLAEVAAKRRTVEFFQKVSGIAGADLYADVSAARDAVEVVLFDMASVYADHPDYDPEWRG